jgi:two-component system, NarL family, nitrate/nitrite response regulator NarL
VIDVAIVCGDGSLLEQLRAWARVHAPDLRVAEAAIGDLVDAPARRPDVVLVDVIQGAAAGVADDVRQLRAAGFWPLAVTRGAGPTLSVALLAAGVCVLMGKDRDSAALVTAVRAVAAGNTTCSGTGVAAPPGNGRPRLSEREEAVLRAYASGLTLVATATHVGIRPATAKTYLDRVKAKYREAGRPANTKLELARRLREDFPHQ